MNALRRLCPSGRVVVAASGRIAIPRRAISFPLVHELGRDDVAVAQLDAVPPDLLVYHGELIAFAHVLNEIDIPFEDAREIHDELVRHAGLNAGLEQRRADHAVRADRAHLELALERGRLEPGGVTSDREDTDVVELTPQRQDLRAVVSDLETVAGLDELEPAPYVRKRNEVREIAEAQAVALEQRVEGVAALDEQLDNGPRKVREGRFGRGRLGDLKLRLGDRDRRRADRTRRDFG